MGLWLGKDKMPQKATFLETFQTPVSDGAINRSGSPSPSAWFGASAHCRNPYLPSTWLSHAGFLRRSLHSISSCIKVCSLSSVRPLSTRPPRDCRPQTPGLPWGLMRPTRYSTPGAPRRSLSAVTVAGSLGQVCTNGNVERALFPSGFFHSGSLQGQDKASVGSAFIARTYSEIMW